MGQSKSKSKSRQKRRDNSERTQSIGDELNDDLGIIRNFHRSNSQQKYSDSSKSRNLKKQIEEMTKKAKSVERACRQADFMDIDSTHNENLCPEDFLKSMKYIEDSVSAFREENKTLQIQKNDYMKRFNTLASERLTEAPYLTDKDRPIKLAEQLHDIYQNEWVDALQELEQFHESNEQERVYHLFCILKVVYKTCLRKAEKHLDRLKQYLYLTKGTVSEQAPQKATNLIDTSVRQHIVESRKKTAHSVTSLLKQSIKQDDTYKKELGDCQPELNDSMVHCVEHSLYFQKCIDICWMFCVQDPPIYVDTDNLKGQQFDKEVHKEYTLSGCHINYVVWPALYLNCKGGKKGALLSMGVVQPEQISASTSNIRVEHKSVHVKIEN